MTTHGKGPRSLGGVPRRQPVADSQVGLLRPFLEGFRAELERLRYAATVVAFYCAGVVRFDRWASDRRLSLEQVSAKTLEAFYTNDSCPNETRPLRRFFDYLRRQGQPVAVYAPPPPPPHLEILRTFGDWMRRHRGLSERTIGDYQYSLREFIERLGDDPSHYDARGLRSYLIEYQDRHGSRSIASKASTPVRVFLRYLAAEGLCKPGLDAAVPTVTHWRRAALPEALRAEQVERLIGTCDNSTAVGRRDRAVLLLLARFGLRAADVRHLRLGDIDWRGGTLRLHGKGRSEARLPLPQEVGDALLAYLEDGRPSVPYDHVFITARAPFRPWNGSTAVCSIVAKRLRLAGIDSASHGAHLLRHSTATGMLRQGASLDEIGAVLRHRSRESTALYAKVDVAQLRLIAQPWPEVTPC